ncbi:MAG: hypothetical protein RSD65_08840, partial [Anaerovoracaceae bacterium]
LAITESLWQTAYMAERVGQCSTPSRMLIKTITCRVEASIVTQFFGTQTSTHNFLKVDFSKKEC